jgi:putative membrane protein
MMYGWRGGGWPGANALGFPWGGIVMAALMLTLIVILILVFIRMGKQGIANRADPRIRDSRSRGMEIIAERFARGEIDAETFRAMKAELEDKH